MYTHVLCVCECPTDLQIVKHNIIGVTARLWNTNNFFIVAHFMLVVFHVLISESYKRDEDTQVKTTLQEQRLRIGHEPRQVRIVCVTTEWCC